MDELDPTKISDTKEHAHIPYAILLPHLGKMWMDSHEGAFPKNYKEKGLFKQMIHKCVFISKTFQPRNVIIPDSFSFFFLFSNSASLDFVKGSGVGQGPEENFEEAASNCHRVYGIPSLDWQTAAVLQDDKAQEANITQESNKFWLAIAALNRFIANEGHGSMPCSTNIPDMISETHYYVKLKKM